MSTTDGVSFEGRVAVVTGAGGGLGRTYALDIARRGGSVVVNDLGGSVEGPGAERSMADSVVEEIRAAGGRAVACYDSVASREGAQAIVATALDAFGRVDAVINNAGNMRIKAFEDYTEDDFNAIVSVHLGGSFHVTQAAWPHLREQGYGRVVFTSSSTGMYGSEMYACYASAKAGVTGLMNVLALEGGPHGIKCNAVMPNAMSRMTDMVSAELAKQMGEDALAEAEQRMAAVGQAMAPEFNTGLAVYLASEACTSSHAIYSACVGRIARVFIGATDGWRGSLEVAASAEDIAAHFEQVRDLASGVHIPESPSDEFRIVLTSPEPVNPKTT